MRNLSLAFLAALCVSCAKDSATTSTDAIHTGPSAPVSVHMDFRTYDEHGHPLAEMISVDRSFRTFRDDKSWQAPNSTDVDVSRGRILDRAKYEFTLSLQGSSGVSNGSSLLTSVTFYLPNLAKGERQDCSSAAEGIDTCLPVFGIYNQNGKTPLFNPRAPFTCSFALSADSADLTFRLQEGEYDGHKYDRTSVLPYTPGDSYSPDADKPFAFAFSCRDSATKERILFGTYSQNGAKIPQL